MKGLVILLVICIVWVMYTETTHTTETTRPTHTTDTTHITHTTDTTDTTEIPESTTDLLPLAMPIKKKSSGIGFVGILAIIYGSLVCLGFITAIITYITERNEYMRYQQENRFRYG